MASEERRYRLTYPATIVVEVDAETPEDARLYARQDVIALLCDGNLVRREIWVLDCGVVNATVAVDAADPEAEEVPA